MPIFFFYPGTFTECHLRKGRSEECKNLYEENFDCFGVKSKSFCHVKTTESRQYYVHKQNLIYVKPHKHLKQL